MAVIVLGHETYAPTLLARKAKKLRNETGGTSIIAPIEQKKIDIREVFTVYLSRPLRLTCTFLPCTYTCLVMSFANLVLYIFFEGFPAIYSGVYGFNPGEAGLAFWPLAIGIVSSLPFVAYFNRYYVRKRTEKQGPAPEARLLMTAFAAPLFIVGFLWTGWTARRDIHWIVPMLGEIPIGIALIFFL